MKYVSLFAAVILLTPVLEAGNCCKVRQCKPCRTSCTQWYKAKDGTYREMIPYREALSRAEDADDMEIELRAAQAQPLKKSEPTKRKLLTRNRPPRSLSCRSLRRVLKPLSPN